MQTIFYLLMVIWFGSEVGYKIKLKSNQNKENSKDKNSLTILWWSVSGAIFLSTFLLNVKEINPMRISSNPMFLVFSLTIIFIGIVGRIFVIKSLGKSFTVDVAISDKQKLKTNGIYSVLRHPSYAFSLLTFLGLGLYLNHWISLVVAFLPPFFAFLYRIKVEEQALISKFGQEYKVYQANAKKLIPYIF